jgi:hypothetical protein
MCSAYRVWLISAVGADSREKISNVRRHVYWVMVKSVPFNWGEWIVNNEPPSIADVPLRFLSVMQAIARIAENIENASCICTSNTPYSPFT